MYNKCNSNLLYILCVYILLIFSFCTCTGSSNNILELRRYLLKNYNKHLRPVTYINQRITVSVLLYIQKFVYLDVNSGLLNTDAFASVKWNDTFLKWTPSEFGNISEIHLRSNEIWIPEIIIENALVGHMLLRSYSDVMVTCNYNGELSWLPEVNLLSYCDVNLREFPFDTQECNIYFESIFYASQQMDMQLYENKHGKGVIGPFFPNLKWSSEKIKATRITYTDFIGSVKEYTVLRYTITLKRDHSIYKYYVLIPYFIASAFAIGLFTVPIGSNTRFIFASLALILLFHLLLYIPNLVTTKIPDAPYLIRCISINILLITISLLVSNIIYRIIISMAGSCPSLPTILTKQFNKPLIVRLLMLPNSYSSDILLDNNGDIQASAHLHESKIIKYQWIILIKLIDRIICIIYIISLIVYHC